MESPRQRAVLSSGKDRENEALVAGAGSQGSWGEQASLPGPGKIETPVMLELEPRLPGGAGMIRDPLGPGQPVRWDPSEAPRPPALRGLALGVA